MLCFVILVCICGFIAIWHITLRWRNKKLYKLTSQLKNDCICLPFIGHAYAFQLGDDEDRMQALQMFGRVAISSGGATGMWLGPYLVVMLADPKLLEVVMKSCLAKDDMMSIGNELFGNGSIFAPVDIWRRRRKAIAPTFSPRNLNQFVGVFSAQSLVMADQLKAVAGKGVFSIWQFLTTFTMDSICESALGIKVNAQINPNQPFLEAFERHCQMASARLCQPPFMQKLYKYMPQYAQYMKHIKTMTDYADKTIENKRVQIEERAKNKGSTDELKTFLELFMESSGGASGFTNLELREEALVLLLAGTDTSAVGAGFTALMLAKHPEVQEKVYEEIQEFFGDSNRPVTAEDLPLLRYLEVVVKESLRLYPPVPVILRKAQRDIMLPNGLEIPKDTAMTINIWAVHRHPAYWGADADEFRPERFLHEVTHPAAYVPFSYGPRSCLGGQYAMMSIKTAIVSLVRHYRVLPCVGGQTQPLRVKFQVMMKHVDNFELKLEARRT